MLFILLLLMMASFEAKAASFQFAGNSGLMVQPSSNYYLLVYGGWVEGGFFNKDVFLVRGGYMERPRFSASGFVDQEFLGYGLIGARIPSSSKGNLIALVGWSEVSGFIDKSSKDDESETTRRRYKMAGPSFYVGYRWTFKKWALGFGHQTIVGFAEPQQTAAFVAWPYNLVLAELGWVL